MPQDEENRKKQIVIGAAILAVTTVCILTAVIGWRYVPGLLGEWLGVIVGVMSTPFFLEISAALFGLFIVLMINSWRRSKEGDEFVYLEQVEGPDVPEDMPENARWAIYQGVPLEVAEPTLLERAEGALAIGDHQAAAGWIAEMEPEELGKPATLEVRLALAEATGKRDIAAKLAHELDRVSRR